MKENKKYTLELSRVLPQLQVVWGKGAALTLVHYNNIACVFGIVMSLGKKRHFLEMIGTYVSSRANLDDHGISLQQIFQSVVMDFNNEKVHVQPPPEVPGILNYELINLNDIS